uniref:Uncharacterized protein n=1 Tax=viral metagenome TaxID=1070528 RepID=A0A6M3IXA5_9ZZZZ
MEKERRNDIGLKTLYVLLTAIITFLLSITFFETYKKADAAVTGVSEIRKDVAVLQSCVKSIDKNYDIINLKLDKLLGWAK